MSEVNGLGTVHVNHQSTLLELKLHSKLNQSPPLLWTQNHLQILHKGNYVNYKLYCYIATRQSFSLRLQTKWIDTMWHYKTKLLIWQENRQQIFIWKFLILQDAIPRFNDTRSENGVWINFSICKFVNPSKNKIEK